MTVTTTSGIDLTHLEPSIRPQDDLFGHVNGRWLAEYPIPADRATDGAFRVLHDRAEEQVREIITGAGTSSDDERRIGDLYASFLDEQAVERRGVAPLLGELALIDAAANPTALAAVIGRFQRSGVGGGVGLYVDTDSKDSSRYLAHLTQSGLGLPDESYYRDEQHAAILGAYPGHIARMFGCVFGGSPDEYAQRAGRIVALETRLAAAHWDVVRRRDAEASYNLQAFAELPRAAPGFDWVGWVTALGGSTESVAQIVVRQPDYLTSFAELWAGADFADWQDWARWRLIHARASVLTNALVAEDFAFYGRILSGTEQIRDRWKRAVSLVEGLMGDAVGRLYVRCHFPPRAKVRMDELVANLREAYRVSISELDWMTPQTRRRALDKLDKFTPKIGYPAKWRDYSSLTIDRDDLYGNVIRGAVLESDRELGKLGGPVDRDEWFMTPQTVNAYYNPGMNEIVFPAAILRWPFFDPEADDAANFGGIGAVIGHEIGHGFDDQGSRYDGDGNLADWWTADDRAGFDALTRALVDQYDGLTPAGLDGHHVNGALTVGENIGDLGGIAIAHRAYLLSVDGAEPPELDGMTGSQRVFLGWAQVWRTATREAEQIRRLAIDPHAPPELRANVVRNLDEFHRAFGVVEGDGMWLDEEARVRIW